MIKIVKIEPIMLDVTDSQSTQKESAPKGSCFVHFYVKQDNLELEGKLEKAGTKEELEKKSLDFDVYLALMGIDQLHC